MADLYFKGIFRDKIMLYLFFCSVNFVMVVEKLFFRGIFVEMRVEKLFSNTIFVGMRVKKLFSDTISVVMVKTCSYFGIVNVLTNIKCSLKHWFFIKKSMFVLPKKKYLLTDSLLIHFI
jgi:hypothetical protein